MPLNQQRVDFINKHSSDVIQSASGTTFLPSLTMAQMILESSGKDENGVFGAGKAITARKANNFFGIKANSSWTGNKLAFSTPKDGKPVNYFRVYVTPLDSIKDHTKFLLENSRYKKAGVFDAKNYREQAIALQKSGYAEGSDGKGGGYADSLIKLIEDYKLYELDKGKEIIEKKTESSLKTTEENQFKIALIALTITAALYIGYKLINKSQTIKTKTK